VAGISFLPQGALAHLHSHDRWCLIACASVTSHARANTNQSCSPHLAACALLLQLVDCCNCVVRLAQLAGIYTSAQQIHLCSSCAMLHNIVKKDNTHTHTHTHTHRMLVIRWMPSSSRGATTVRLQYRCLISATTTLALTTVGRCVVGRKKASMTQRRVWLSLTRQSSQTWPRWSSMARVTT
jgi:hypothetical protein